jgi:hypothetical protein
MVEVIRAGAPAPAPSTSRRKSTIGKLFAGKALVAMATVALTATGAAAATGSLPAPVQDAVSEAVSHVGVNLPAKGGKSADRRQDGEHRQSGENGKSDGKGQSGEDHGRPAGDGEDAGDNPGQGAEISDLTHDPALDGLPKGPIVSDVASDGKSQAGEHGQPADGSTTTTIEGSTDDSPAPSEGDVDEDDESDNEHTPPVTTGGKSTGEERSGRDLEPQGKGKGSSEDN